METQSKTVAQHIDYKNINKIKSNLNPHSRMHGRRRTKMTAREQRDFAVAVKRARFMALVPYVSH